jgi:hypothetical protein
MKPAHFLQVIIKGEITSVWRAMRWGKRVIVVFSGRTCAGRTSVSLPRYDRRFMQLIPMPPGSNGWTVGYDEALAKAPAACLRRMAGLEEKNA